MMLQNFLLIQAATVAESASPSLTEFQCPPRFPYAYQDGGRCCSSDKDIYGADLTISSRTCKKGDSATCTNEPCWNGKICGDDELQRFITSDNTMDPLDTITCTGANTSRKCAAKCKPTHSTGDAFVGAKCNSGAPEIVGSCTQFVFLRTGNKDSEEAKSEGNVYVNGAPVCDDEWDDVDATVVCKMLGFDSGVATVALKYGEVEEEFAMDDVKCTGDETSLLDCPHATTDNCGVSEGAGVECTGN